MPQTRRDRARGRGSLGIPAVDEAGEIRTLEAMEADMIRLALGRYRGHMTEVAKRLNIGRSTLYRKMKDYGLEEREAETVRVGALSLHNRMPGDPRGRRAFVVAVLERYRGEPSADHVVCWIADSSQASGRAPSGRRNVQISVISCGSVRLPETTLPEAASTMASVSE